MVIDSLNDDFTKWRLKYKYQIGGIHLFKEINRLKFIY